MYGVFAVEIVLLMRIVVYGVFAEGVVLLMPNSWISRECAQLDSVFSECDRGGGGGRFSPVVLGQNVG